jgi:hypothetical protein
MTQLHETGEDSDPNLEGAQPTPDELTDEQPGVTPEAAAFDVTAELSGDDIDADYLIPKKTTIYGLPGTDDFFKEPEHITGGDQGIIEVTPANNLKILKHSPGDTIIISQPKEEYRSTLLELLGIKLDLNPENIKKIEPTLKGQPTTPTK